MTAPHWCNGHCKCKHSDCIGCLALQSSRRWLGQLLVTRRAPLAARRKHPLRTWPTASRLQRATRGLPVWWRGAQLWTWLPPSSASWHAALSHWQRRTGASCRQGSVLRAPLWRTELIGRPMDHAQCDVASSAKARHMASRPSPLTCQPDFQQCCPIQQWRLALKLLFLVAGPVWHPSAALCKAGWAGAAAHCPPGCPGCPAPGPDSRGALLCGHSGARSPQPPAGAP